MLLVNSISLHHFMTGIILNLKRHPDPAEDDWEATIDPDIGKCEFVDNQGCQHRMMRQK
jgi:hypothetical protein